MTEEESRQVARWLYSIPRKEIALGNLKRKLEWLDTKRASPPQWSSNPEAIPVRGGDLDSRQQRWLEFLDGYIMQRRELEQQIDAIEQELDGFYQVLEMLRSENSMYAQLVKKKYIEKVRPDSVIWETVLFVGKTKFYELRHYVLETFFESLPALFPRTKREPKSA